MRGSEIKKKHVIAYRRMLKPYIEDFPSVGNGPGTWLIVPCAGGSVRLGQYEVQERDLSQLQR